jgi:hypothetical protein
MRNPHAMGSEKRNSSGKTLVNTTTSIKLASETAIASFLCKLYTFVWRDERGIYVWANSLSLVFKRGGGKWVQVGQRPLHQGSERRVGFWQ